MPAKKAGRQSIKQYGRNGSARTATRSAVSKALKSLEDGDVAVAEGTVRDAIRHNDRAVRKGILHKNAAARRKSRISVRLNRLQSA